MTENFIKIPRKLVYNLNNETKKVGKTIMNTIEDGGIAIAFILYLDARCFCNGCYAFSLEEAMADLGINPTKGKNGNVNKVKNVLKALEEQGILKFYKPIDKIKLDSMIKCEINFTFDKEYGEDVNWFSVPYSHIDKILEEVPSKSIVNCLVVETMVQGRKFNGSSRETIGICCTDKNYPGCARLSWSYVKDNISMVFKKKDTWNKYVSILESIGLLYTAVPIVNGEKKSKIYGYNQKEVDWVRKEEEDKPNIEESKESERKVKAMSKESNKRRRRKDF